MKNFKKVRIPVITAVVQAKVTIEVVEYDVKEASKLAMKKKNT